MSDALEEIAAERKRQIEAEGWTPEHDDTHTDYSLATAACIYAFGATLDGPERAVMEEFGLSGTPGWLKEMWPWDYKWWKPADRRRDLVKAGALIAAEIDRLDRLTAPTEITPATGGKAERAALVKAARQRVLRAVRRVRTKP